MKCRGTTVFRVAAAAAPITRNPAAWVKSPRTVGRNSAGPVCWSAAGRRSRGFIHSGRPSFSHSQPTSTAVSRPATSRAHTIRGSFWKATAVATRTIGLIAGADSRNARAADGRTPRSINRWAMGTEPHSHPGRAIPQTPASGTASAADSGITLAKKLAGTNAAIAPDTSTPSTRNGVACTQMATKTVAQPDGSTAVSQPASCRRSSTAVSRMSPKISSDPGEYFGFAGRAAGR